MLDLTDDPDSGVDPEIVELLVHQAIDAMSAEDLIDQSSPSEIVSACFLLLDRTLRGVRRLQTPSERTSNVAEIRRCLQELLIDHGSLPS